MKPSSAERKRTERRIESRVIVHNRAASFHYTITERYEAGLVLLGSEVKSIRGGKVDIAEAFAHVERGEVWLRNMHVSGYAFARAFPHTERGARKLLLHTKEIRAIERAVSREGYALVPIDLHFVQGRVKVLLGLGMGKKLHDKRAALAKKTEDREALEAIRAAQKR
jgi:SsrA-binding protein